VNRSNEKDRRLSPLRPFSLQGALLTAGTLCIAPARAVPPEEGTVAPRRQPLHHQSTAEPRVCSAHPMVGRIASPNILVFSVFTPCLSYTSAPECPRLRVSMRRDSVQHRTARSFGKGAPAPRLAPRRPRARRRPAVTRRRAALAAGRRRRRPLLFYALAASVAGELAAIVVDVEALVLLSSLTGLFLCTVIFRAAKT
jgi:hypothetical protein